jgi:hypothetical protein
MINHERLVVTTRVGRAIAQVVSSRLPTAAARVRAQVRSCGIRGGQSGTGAGFLRAFRFPLLPILIAPTAPHSSSSTIRGWCNRQISVRCTKRPPSISRQTRAAAWHCCLRSSVVLGGTAWASSFTCSNREKIHRSGSGDRGGQTIGPRRLIHIPGCATFNHCRTSPQLCVEAPSYWNHNLCLTPWGSSSSSPGRTVSTNSWYPWAVSLSSPRVFQPKRWS